MTPVELNSQTALTPGCDLWIIADVQSSKWSRRIDWYLNFQLARAQSHRKPKPCSELSQVLTEFEVSTPELPRVDSHWPLMVASSRLLPASKTVLVPDSADAISWVERCLSVWNQLGRPPTRVFLPDHIPTASFQSAWSAAKIADVNAALEFVSVSATEF